MNVFVLFFYFFLCVILDLRWKLSSLLPLSTMLAVGFL